MAAIDLVSASLVAIVVESAMYGVFLVLFIGCMYALLHKRRRTHRNTSVQFDRDINWTMLWMAVILFASITTHWIIDIRRLFLAFVITKDGPLLYYANLALPLDLARTTLYVFEAVMGDIIMVYRLWVVWNHNKVVVLPPLLAVFGLIATGSGIVIEFSKLQLGQNPFGLSSGRFITSSFVLTLATQIYSTSFIAYKIWSVNKVLRNMGTGNLTSVVVIIAESAAVYTVWVFITLVTYLANSNIQFALLDMMSPVNGAVFCLIIVRVSMGMSIRTYDTATATGLRSVHWSERTERTDGSGSQAAHPLSPIRVDVHKHIDIGGKDFVPDQKDSEAVSDYSPSLDASRSRLDDDA